MIPAVVLAAGASRRLGRPKQLLPWQGTTLVGHAVGTAAAAGCDPVLVVTGAHREPVERSLSDARVIVVPNPDWTEGQGASLKAGVSALRERCPAARGVLLLTCDQPRLTADVLRRLVSAWEESGLPMAACVYEGVAGVPAVFARSMFPRLLDVRGDRGARDLLRSAGARVCRLPWPEGAIDVDGPGDDVKER